MISAQGRIAEVSRSRLIAAHVEGYYDESEPEAGERVFVVAGYLMLAEDARPMEEEWGAVLEPHGIKVFHMADCAAEPGNAEFSGISKGVRSEIVRSLIVIIHKYARAGLAVVTSPKDWEADTEFNHYSHCCLNMAIYAKAWAEQSGFGDLKIHHFFEQGYKHQKDAVREFTERFGAADNASFTFLGKDDAVLLQAADLLAWQAGKFAKESLLSDRPMRKDFAALVEKKHLLVYSRPAADKVDIVYLDFEPHIESVEKKQSIIGTLGGQDAAFSVAYAAHVEPYIDENGMVRLRAQPKR